METIFTISYPFTRAKRHIFCNPASLGWWQRLRLRLENQGWHCWLWTCYHSSIGQFGGSKTNHKWSISILGWNVATFRRNEYHDRTDEERADEYLKKWSACEKELRGLRLLYLGDHTGADVKALIKESLGVDLDEGRIM